MQFFGDICGVFVITVSTRVLKSQIFSRVLWFLLSESINLLSISHIPMTHLTHFRIFSEQVQVHIYIENLTRKWTKSRTFFSKIRTLFSIFKKGQERPPPLPIPPSRAPDIYIYICIYIYLYIHKYIYINIYKTENCIHVCVWLKN